MYIDADVFISSFICLLCQEYLIPPQLQFTVLTITVSINHNKCAWKCVWVITGKDARMH
jgi:hypothetical protein